MQYQNYHSEVRMIEEVRSEDTAVVFLQEYMGFMLPAFTADIGSTAHNTTLQGISDRSAKRAFEIIKEHTSHNSHRAQKGDLLYWRAWLTAIGFAFDRHISEQEIIAFIVQHAEGLDTIIDEQLVSQGIKQKPGPHKLSTIKRRIASLSSMLEAGKLPNPSHNKEIKLLLNKLTKKYGGSRPAGKAITKEILDEMLNTCGTTLIDIRDKAMLLFAWASGGRRRTEVITANMKDLTQTLEGNYTYKIPQSKTDQQGEGYTVPVKGRAARALCEWLTGSGVGEGAIFRTVAKGGKLKGALSGVDLYRVVRSRLKKAGYNEKEFGAHSLRSGFVTEAGRRGKPLGDVMQMTTHRNIGTVMKYYQAGNIINNSAANLAD
jgi:integrase